MKPLPVVPTPAAPAPAGGTPAAEAPAMVPDTGKTEALRPQILEALSAVFDPEIPVNICELGLIYDIIVDASGQVSIRMTLTAPACPAAQSLPAEVSRAVACIPGVAGVSVDLVWDPPWSRERMSEAAKLQLGMF